MSLKGSHVKSLSHQSVAQCQVVQPVGGGASRDVRSLGSCPWRSKFWGSSPSAVRWTAFFFFLKNFWSWGVQEEGREWEWDWHITWEKTVSKEKHFFIFHLTTHSHFIALYLFLHVPVCVQAWVHVHATLHVKVRGKLTSVLSFHHVSIETKVRPIKLAHRCPYPELGKQLWPWVPHPSVCLTTCQKWKQLTVDWNPWNHDPK